MAAPAPLNGKVFNRDLIISGLGRIFVNGFMVRHKTGLSLDVTVPATITTAGAVTYSLTQLFGRFILRDTNGAPRTDTTPTAAAIVREFKNAVVGCSFDFEIRNNSGAANAVTLAGGTNVTISGTATIAQSNTKRFRLVITNADVGSEAVTIYSMGTSTF